MCCAQQRRFFCAIIPVEAHIGYIGVANVSWKFSHTLCKTLVHDSQSCVMTLAFLRTGHLHLFLLP